MGIEPELDGSINEFGKRTHHEARNRLSAEFILQAAPRATPYRLRRRLFLASGLDRRWCFYRYMRAGRSHDLGLGDSFIPSAYGARYPDQKRAAANWLKVILGKAEGFDQQLLRGEDPAGDRQRVQQAAKLAEASRITFRQCAERYIEANKPGWRNEKHAAQWTASLATYTYPTIGDLPASTIDTGHITNILQPIWAAKPETASRVRGRIEAVLDFAATHGWRSGENPARWKGHLENVLPRRSKVAKVQHHAALPWQQLGPFMRDIERQDGVAALALRFTILTAARTGEAIDATWGEIDTGSALWTVPEGRTKGGREHRVPLSEAALTVLKAAAALRSAETGDWVFPGGRAGKPLSNMAMLTLLERMGRGDLTTHGFRSTFRDWCAETGQPADVAEAALGHVVGDKTVAAYQRGDLLERRRNLMEAWAQFASASTGRKAVPRSSAS
jgi:integrase